jgi:hypothetical protein
MKENKEVEMFYQNVSDLLKCDDHKYFETYEKKTRWNNRNPGNGRFANHGLVRYYNSSCVHVNLYNPGIFGIFSVEDTLNLLKMKYIPAAPL